MTQTPAAILFLGTVLLASGPAHGQAPKGSTEPGARQALVARALSAAPPAIGEGAAVVDMTDDGRTTTIRDGRNGWACLPRDPGTPYAIVILPVR